MNFALTRDSIVLWIGWLGGAATMVAAYADIIPMQYRNDVVLYAGLVSSICGWLKTSPLVGEKSK